jgi:hypothetical protein
MTRRKGAHNRGNTVLTPSHPECQACDLLREKLDGQIVENGRWRLLVMDLKAALSQAGGVCEPADYHPRREPVAGTCCHGTDLHRTCDDCGRVLPNDL